MPGLSSIGGECVPFYKLNGLSDDSMPSDLIPDSVLKDADTGRISRDFLSDVSIGDASLYVFRDKALQERYINQLMLRFAIEWPCIELDIELFADVARQALSRHARAGKVFSRQAFYIELIRGLRAHYPEINPFYYDIPASLVRKSFPDINVPEGPPNHVAMIEEPPFILISPSRAVAKGDFINTTLILKSPLNCYRMNFIKRAFSNARIKIIYLARNPLASINGLYDGWLHHGFFSHNLKRYFSKKGDINSLEIKGYSENAPWARWWWKFDLPPGWVEYAKKGLEEVCAFQWRKANEAIMEYLGSTKGVESLHVRYEDIVGDLWKRKAEFARIAGFIGMDDIGSLRIETLPLIQATKAPRPKRWKKRGGLILPVVLNDRRVMDMCDSLGYPSEEIENWP
jgi:hypothetical protein